MPLSRLVRVLCTGALAAAGLQVAMLGVAPPASAAAPLDCTGALYLTDSSNDGRVLRLGLDGSLGTTSVYDPTTGATGNPNQLGISAGGTRVINTDRTTNRIVNQLRSTEEYSVAEAPAVATYGIAGAINPADGLYYYGGYSGSNLVLYSYDPVANTASAAPVATIAAPNTPAGGTNGDITFDPAGNLYFVASSGTDFALYSFGGPAPTNGTATRLSGDTGLGGAAVNGLAFASDAFLYLGQGTQVRQVNPITGELTGVNFALTGGVSSTDLASCAEAPSSLTVKKNVTGRRAATDQFTLTATRPVEDGTTSFPTGTTTGTDTGLQNTTAEVAGPAIIFPARSYGISEAASGTTTLSAYTSSWECRDNNGTLVDQGTGPTGTFTAPAAGGLAITCTFTNTAIAPALTLDKTVSPNRFSAAGQTLTYTFEVANTGNAAIDDLAIDDGLPGLSAPVCAPIALGDTLAVGEDTTCTATYTVTSADVAAGDKVNTATATGNPPAGTGLPPVTSPPSTATADFVPLPVATDDTATTPFETPVTLPATGNDSPGDPAGSLDPSATVFTSPQATNGGRTLVTDEGTWQVNPNGTVTFAPATGYTGTTPPVEYRITDNEGGTDTATLVVTVRPGPAAAPDQDTTQQDVTVALDPPALSNDTPSQEADGTPGTFVVSSLVFTPGGTPGGTVTDGGKTLTVEGQGVFTIGAGGRVTFDPLPQFTGTTSPAAYTVTDSVGNQTGSTIRIVVAPVTPAANDDSASTPFDTPVTLPAATDDDAGAASAPLVPSSTVFTSPQAANGGKTLVTPEGTWQVNPGGTVTFTPAAGYTGTTPPVEYQITDDNGTTDVAQLRVTVRPGPQALPDTGTTPQDTSITVSVLPNDTPGTLPGGTPGTFGPASVVFTDPAATNNGRTLVVPGQGTYTIDPATGNITFDPLPEFTGQATPVAYKVTDSNGNSTSSTLTITVAADAPVEETSADLALDKRVVGGTHATPGDLVRYRLQVSNTGRGAAASPITLTDPLPDGLELRSAHGKGWKCTVRKAADTVKCVRTRTLGADTSAPPVFVVAEATRKAMGPVVNVARVRAGGDSVRSNNRDNASITVVPKRLPSTGFGPVPDLP